MSVKISVIVTAFTKRNYIVNALESVLIQDFPKSEYEVILVANFRDVMVENYCAINGIKFIYSVLTNYFGKIKEALRESSGDIICFLDDDDLFEKKK